MIARAAVLRDGDHRVTCRQCAHHRPLAFSCANHRAAGLLFGEVGRAMAALKQHCPGFAPRPPH